MTTAAFTPRPGFPPRDCPVRPAETATASVAGDNRVTLNELMHRTGTGDPAAFEQLYRLMAPRVAALCRRIIVDVHEADDVTQDVMMEIWTKANRFDNSRGSAVSWLLAITHHRAVDRVRTLEAARRRDTHYTTGDYQPAVDDTAAQMLTADERTAVTAAVAQLSQLRRQALAHTYYSGHSYAHASSVLGVPLGTFKSRVHDAIRALHTALISNEAA